MATRKTQEQLAKGAKSRKAEPAPEPVSESNSTMDAGVPVVAAPVARAFELDVVAALRDIAKAIREAGLARAVAPPPKAEAAPRVPSSVSSLPPTAPAEPPHAVGETRHAPTPPLPATLTKVHEEAKQQEAAPTATLQQAQQAVLKHSAANGSSVTAGILKSLGVERVSAVTGPDAPAKYAAIVKALA